MADVKTYKLSESDWKKAQAVLAELDRSVDDSKKDLAKLNVEDPTPDETQEQRLDRYRANINACFSEYLSRPEDGVFFLPSLFRININNPHFKEACYDEAAVNTISKDDSLAALIVEGITAEDFGPPAGGSTVPPKVSTAKK